MRVAILTSGRFHVLNLACELVRLGHDVTFYSLVPPWRTRRFGLPDRHARWLGPWVGPLWLAARALGPTSAGRVAQRAMAEALDMAASRLVGPCDAFIGMSGMSLYTLRRVKRRFGATTFVERASLHIREQKRILDARPRRPGGASDVPDWVVAREESEYAEADLISVPASHAAASFLARGVPAERLVSNPFGVSLDEFPPTPAPPHEPPRILSTSVWSWQKGSDLLASALALVRVALPSAELVHVGPVGDLPLPAAPGFHHVDAVPQARLSSFYAAAHALALPSRQDGLPVVTLQALASGVPVVCSTRAAGHDLAARVDVPSAVTVVPPDDVQALADALIAVLSRRPPPGAPRALLGPEARRELTWQAYGERWSATLARVVRRQAS
ncbi:MAG: glycosyltransferase family 4 protein [Deltaproteobacteria bacterium]|nr:glycosyltransferase family 4 protein [Deltaproteobacteria bacterium]